MSDIDRSEAQKYILLTSSSAYFNEKANTLWDENSGLPGLLAATTGANSKYRYSPGSDSYYVTSTGRKVSDAQIRAAVDKVATKVKRDMREATQQLISGVILAAAWYLQMQTLMSVLYKTMWTLAIGGFLFDDQTARNIFYYFVYRQFKWLDNYYDQVNNRSQPLNGTAMNRSGLYGEYANSLYQNAVLDKKIKAKKMTEGKRILGKNENHCYNSQYRLGCIDLAQKGWLPIERITPIGEATCYSNCHCYIIYR